MGKLNARVGIFDGTTTGADDVIGDLEGFAVGSSVGGREAELLVEKWEILIEKELGEVKVNWLGRSRGGRADSGRN